MDGGGGGGLGGGGGVNQNRQGPAPPAPVWRDNTGFTPSLTYLGGGGVMPREGIPPYYSFGNYGAYQNQNPNLGSPQEQACHQVYRELRYQQQQQQQQLQNRSALGGGGGVGGPVGGAGPGGCWGGDQNQFPVPPPRASRGVLRYHSGGVGGVSPIMSPYPYVASPSPPTSMPPRQYTLDPYPNPFQHPPLPFQYMMDAANSLNPVGLNAVPPANVMGASQQTGSGYWNGGVQEAQGMFSPSAPLSLTDSPSKEPQPGLETPSELEPEAKPKAPAKVLIGKRRGGSKFLPTGVIKRPRESKAAAGAGADETGTHDDSKPEGRKWSRYFEEVEKYRKQTCKDENQNHPLVK